LVFAFYGVYAVLVATALVDGPFGDTFDWQMLFSVLIFPMYSFPLAVSLTAALQLWRLWKCRRDVPRVVLHGIAPAITRHRDVTQHSAGRHWRRCPCLDELRALVNAVVPLAMNFVANSAQRPTG